MVVFVFVGISEGRKLERIDSQRFKVFVWPNQNKKETLSFVQFHLINLGFHQALFFKRPQTIH